MDHRRFQLRKEAGGEWCVIDTHVRHPDWPNHYLVLGRGSEGAMVQLLSELCGLRTFRLTLSAIRRRAGR